MKRAVTIHAPAKINLALQVLGRRADGYHQIVSVVAAIDLCDELRLKPGREPGIALRCDDARTPANGRNVVCRAAEVLARRYGRKPNLAVELVKRIPVGAGLGGGSSDAAAVLVELSRQWGLAVSREALSPTAAEVGSDVPFFLFCGTALVRGRGERIEPLDWQPPGWVLLLLPQLQVRTEQVYRAWRAGGPPRPERWWQVRPGTARELSQWCFNDLSDAAERVAPGIGQIRRRLLKLGLEPIHLTGSGSAIFALFDDRQQAQQWAERIERQLDIRTCVCGYVKQR